MGPPLSAEEMEQCLELLQRLADNYRAQEPHPRLHSLIRKLHLEGKKRLHRERLDFREQMRRQDRALLATTELVQHQSDAPLLALPGPQGERLLNEPEHCYVCKEPYRQVHFFYHFLCPKCAAFNYEMRDLHADLKGRIALVTGGRVKIGHQLVLRLLRDGAQVLVSTRFPQAAVRRFAEEPDFPEWRERLRVFGLDLRNLHAVEHFCDQLVEQLSHLDILVHNAAQTIQRPPGFYRELLSQENQPLAALPAAQQELVGRLVPPSSSDSGLDLSRDVLPLDRFHDREERVDHRDINSWLLPLEDVSTLELVEVQLVNSIAPFILNRRLKPLLLRSPFARRFIVNVSAMEGQFARNKTIYHPHTNMAKAALNMMTHTSAPGYVREGIYMNSVDTGWVTDENPTPKRLRRQEQGFFAPLDIVDGMARIYHPIAWGVERPEEPHWGQFLKDYAPCKW